MLAEPSKSVAETIPTETHNLPDGVAAVIDREHHVLIRRLAVMQQRVSQLVLSYEAQLAHWKHQLMRQSARLMLERTRTAWGLVNLPGPEPASCLEAQRVVAQAHARVVVCRVGCQMDGYHWRQGEQCRLSGQDCADSA